MYCPYCGAPNSAGVQTCINCRRPLVTVAAPTPYYNYSAAPAYTPVYPLVPGQLAGFWLRFGAWLIDSIITGLAAALAVGIPLAIWFGSFWQKYGQEFINGCGADSVGYNQTCQQLVNRALQSEASSLAAVIGGGSLLALVLYLLYYVGLTASGSTLGKKLFGLKVVKADGSAPGIGIALLRQTIGYWLSGLFFALGFIWAAFDDRRQAWHDKLAQTYVIKV